jgi:hypothetical protein
LPASLFHHGRGGRGHGLVGPAAQLARQIHQADERPLAEQNGSLDDVFQLADVARPPVRDEAVDGLGLDAGDLLFQAFVEAREEVVDQSGMSSRRSRSGGR